MRYAETGYNLEVDLSQGSVSRVKTDPGLTRLHLGGQGTAARILWDRVPAETDPLSADNLLIFSTGLLHGTPVTGANRTSVSTFSPQTNLYVNSLMGGWFGPELKHAGYDKIIIRGQAPGLVYLWIHNDKVEIRDARHLQGKGCQETATLLQKELNDPRIQVAAIGLAGENRVYQATIEHANSSAYLLVNFPWIYVRESFCHILSHEFFHAWNVKRIHSNKLGPFDYTKPVKTKELWFAEGVTDYYGDVSNVRAGVWSDTQFASTVTANIAQVGEAPEPWSVEDGSAATWIDEVFVNSSQLYYPKGSLLGLLLDVTIRDATDNARSLDDVMRALYTRFAQRGRGFATADLLALLKEFGMPDAETFFGRYVNGREPLPYEDGSVRRVRIGAHPDGSTRVVLDLDGAGRHSVYALYNPYRIVVDVERPAADGGAPGEEILGEVDASHQRHEPRERCREDQDAEDSYREKGVSEDEAEERAWRTVNAIHHGGEKRGGSGYGKKDDPRVYLRAGRIGGRAAASRPRRARSRSAKKAARTRARAR